MIFEGLLAACLVLLVVNLVLTLKNRHRGLDTALAALEREIAKLETALRDESGRNRDEANRNAAAGRDELGRAFKRMSEALAARMAEIAQLQKNQLDSFARQIGHLTETNDHRLEKMRETIATQLAAIQADNARKLESMRATVDEKLHNTLEQRLGDSFRIVSDRLEQVHKGLGEMQTLATGVGDLKKVLTNVKTRGVLGEYQLENILEQLLAPDQYDRNVKTRAGSNAMVEFAVKLPGRQEPHRGVWLPLDAKFPTEDYQSLLAAYEAADPAAIEGARKALALRIRLSAREIRDKYIDPPNTTDFGIMFLPFEGLYAEVLRDGLFESVQREYKIVICGPTTLAAFLNSLQMGFRTLAIEKRSSEVWEILGAVKTEFGKFGAVLEKTRKKLNEASNVIDQAGVRSRAIEKRLRDVEELPVPQAESLLTD